jgi:hypothetical protein
VSMATWEVQSTPAQYTAAFFGAIAIVVLTWQGLNLVSRPEEWLIRHGRAIGEHHTLAVDSKPLHQVSFSAPYFNNLRISLSLECVQNVRLINTTVPSQRLMRCRRT